MDDGFSTTNPRTAIAPQASSSNTPIVGAIIDSQGYTETCYVIAAGALYAGSSFAVLLEDGNDSGLSDHATVVAGLQGTAALAGFAAANANGSFKIGYKNVKRYSRLTITPSANGATSYLAASAVLQRPTLSPTPNPPT